MRVTAQDVEICVAEHFNARVNVIVPNVHWGMGLMYEADLVVLRKSGYAAEVEIKVSAADIRADLKKRHRHDSSLFRELWFAVPRDLDRHPDIPEQAGILSVDHTAECAFRKCCRIRPAKTRKNAKRWTDKQRMKLMALGVMRIWTLKRHLAKERKADHESTHPGV